MNLKRILLVANLHGGTRQGQALLREVEPVFQAAGVELEVVTTQYADHATEIARTGDLARFDAVCILGGDGTVHQVANGLLSREDGRALPLGLLPAGSGNTVHQEFGCTDPLQAARQILSGTPRFIDVAEVTTAGTAFYSINMIGWGAVADINRRAEQLRGLGPIRYSMAALWQIVFPIPRRARLILDRETIEDEFQFILACNTRHTGRGMLVAPQAQVDDGLLDLVTFQATSRRAMWRVFRAVADGSHLDEPGIAYRQVKQFRLETDQPSQLNIDGENVGSSPFAVRVLPSALSILGDCQR